MRNQQLDKYIEELFGKPDFTQSIVKKGLVWTPMGNKVRLWRVDPLIPSLEKGG